MQLLSPSLKKLEKGKLLHERLNPHDFAVWGNLKEKLRSKKISIVNGFENSKEHRTRSGVPAALYDTPNEGICESQRWTFRAIYISYVELCFSVYFIEKLVSTSVFRRKSKRDQSGMLGNRSKHTRIG
ncbi:unnamed protein product [Cylicostephanus goldi]|uniref:Uncharacterized protein n=1 Tax=Cylicostephanus goldi TaxID=71465 RepID=A0A3P7MU91_CYLGO|nr:unnamed protein product [Cylicostephanus goldi]